MIHLGLCMCNNRWDATVTYENTPRIHISLAPLHYIIMPWVLQNWLSNDNSRVIPSLDVDKRRASSINTNAWQESVALTIFSQLFDQIVDKQDEKKARREPLLSHPHGCSDDGRADDDTCDVIHGNQSTAPHAATCWTVVLGTWSYA